MIQVAYKAASRRSRSLRKILTSANKLFKSGGFLVSNRRYSVEVTYVLLMTSKCFKHCRMLLMKQLLCLFLMPVNPFPGI